MSSREPAAPPASPIDHLWERAPLQGEHRGSPMPPALATRYGGPLDVPLRGDRPTVLMNFVSTVDGVVALGTGRDAGGGVISGFFEPDRFVMALLRAVSDVLVMGAGTIRGGSSHEWTADHLHRDHAADFARWRADLGLAQHPTVVIVTGSGDVQLGKRGLDDPNVPVVFATTVDGAQRLARTDLPAHARVETVGTGPKLTAPDLATLLKRLDARVVLSEGGPHLYGDLIEADLVDELFLTVAPQLIGRDGGRFGLIEGVALRPDEARWQELVSVKRAGDHLFLRYRRPR